MDAWDRFMAEWMDGCMDGCMDVCMYGWMDLYDTLHFFRLFTP